MRALTHLLFSAVCLLIYLEYLNVENTVLFSSLLFFTTLFVDIDEPDSTIGRIFWMFSRPIKLILGHRGLFHSLIIPTILFLWSYFFQITEIGIAVFLGYASHLLMDMLTPHGIYPLYPLSWKIKGPIRVGSWKEYLFASLLFFGIVIKLLL